MTFYIANVIGGEGVRILDAPSPSRRTPTVPYGDEGVVALYGDEEGATVHVEADDENDAERRIISTFGEDATIDDLQYCACNDQANPRWADDAVQFPRLLAEIMATVELTEKQWNDLLEAMDLESDDLSELFDRAQRQWEKQKATLR